MIIGSSSSDKEKIRQILQKNSAKVYFLGIGGISMSSLALMLKMRGISVLGSDIRRSAVTDALIKKGIKIRFSHTREAIMSFSPDMAVYSLSVNEKNAEYIAAKGMNIPAVSRAELLGVLMEDYGVKIGISGSHGKSTTTAMMGKILDSAGCTPTVLCGAEIKDSLGFSEGRSDYLVYEACEYGDSFLNFAPDIQILLNLELDHTDYFSGEEAIRASFIKAANRAQRACILNLDSENLRIIKHDIKSPVYTFSRKNEADYRYETERDSTGRYSFKLYKQNEYLGKYMLGVKGGFNVSNAVAAAVTADVLQIPVEAAREALSSFSGLKRRLELLNSAFGFDVYYDYAHHPSEICAAREALSDMGYKKITAVFAPHTYSRTYAFFEHFANELSKFDNVYITDIFGARETALTGVTSSKLAERVREIGGKCHSVSPSETENVIKQICENKPDCLVLMGAGNLDSYKDRIINL